MKPIYLTHEKNTRTERHVQTSLGREPVVTVIPTTEWIGYAIGHDGSRLLSRVFTSEPNMRAWLRGDTALAVYRDRYPDGFVLLDENPEAPGESFAQVLETLK